MPLLNRSTPFATRSSYERTSLWIALPQPLKITAYCPVWLVPVY